MKGYSHSLYEKRSKLLESKKKTVTGGKGKNKFFVGILKMMPTSCSSQSGASAKCEKVHGIVMEISGFCLEN